MDYHMSQIYIRPSVCHINTIANPKKKKQKHKLEEITKFYHVFNEFFFFIVRLVCEKCKFDICKEDDPNRFV